MQEILGVALKWLKDSSYFPVYQNAEVIHRYIKVSMSARSARFPQTQWAVTHIKIMKLICLICLWSEWVEFKMCLQRQTYLIPLAKTSPTTWRSFSVWVMAACVLAFASVCLSVRVRVFVCLCACCHVSAAIFFGWFVISSIYLFSVNLCSVLAILLILSLDSHLESPVNPMSVFLDCGGDGHAGTGRKCKLYTEMPGIKPRTFSEQGPFFIPAETVVHSALSDILKVVRNSLTAGCVSKESAAVGLRHDTLEAKWDLDTESYGDLLFLAVKHREMRRGRGVKKKDRIGWNGGKQPRVRKGTARRFSQNKESERLCRQSQTLLIFQILKSFDLNVSPALKTPAWGEDPCLQ